MTGGLPDFFLLKSVYAGCGVSLLVIPDGLYFYKDDCISITCYNIQLTATIGVIAGKNLKSLTHEKCCSQAFNEVSFRLVFLFSDTCILTFPIHR